MARGRRRKCKCCRKLFRPDPRNLRPRSRSRSASVKTLLDLLAHSTADPDFSSVKVAASPRFEPTERRPRLQSLRATRLSWR
jgi:hypothetical protein